MNSLIILYLINAFNCSSQEYLPEYIFQIVFKTGIQSLLFDWLWRVSWWDLELLLETGAPAVMESVVSVHFDQDQFLQLAHLCLPV